MKFTCVVSFQKSNVLRMYLTVFLILKLILVCTLLSVDFTLVSNCLANGFWEDLFKNTTEA